MTDELAFDELILLARAGNEPAMVQLVARYEPEVRMVARARLGAALRPYLDSIDIVQSVHRSLMVGLRAQSFDISSPNHLVALALTMVQRKVARQWRKHRRQLRCGEQSSESYAADLADLFPSLVSSDASVARTAELEEAAQRIFAELDELETKIIRLRFEGHSTADVARSLDLDPDMLRVRLSRLRKRLRDRGITEEWL